jgi:hypothetical protein
VRRFALLVGANDGGSDRVRLRYANSDADAMADVLRDLGGVGAGDLVHLRDPTPAEVDAAFDDLADKLREASDSGARTQILFYYSGHSDEKGLLLGGARIEYSRLRKRVQSVPADVRIAILDSCASGAFTRTKGGTRRAPFLVGAASSVEGHAFLTSSSADEAAQESDRVGGSFFTHYFNSGLRGAADIDGDRFVTLTEAYRYAFESTLARTESTRGGAQHAAYDIQLAGSGDLVMTDLHKPSATLVLGGDVVGRVSIRGSSGRLAAEVEKPKGGGPLSLAVEPGKYQILVDDGSKRRKASVEVGRGGRVAVLAADLREVPTEYATLRGDGKYVEVPFDIGLLPPASINGRKARKLHDPDARIRNRVSLGFAWNRAARVDGVQLGLGAAIVDEHMHGIQGTSGVAIVRGDLEGWQFSYLFGRAKRVVGAQTSMIVHADEVTKGAQLGFVSIAKKVHGAQVGLVTWAEEADAAIGLITPTKQGNVHPEIWTSDITSFGFGIRLPAKYTYSSIAIGIHPFGRGASYQFGFVWGGHVPIGNGGAFMDIDIGGHVVLDGLSKPVRGPAGLGQLRLLFGYQPFDRLSVFGGPTLSVLGDEHTDPKRAVDRPGYGWVVFEHEDGDARVRVWPGFAAGLRF